MKRMKTKKLLSLAIAAVMILTLIPVGAFSVAAADAPTGSGTAEDPYLIDDKATWEYISANAATYAASHMKLTGNIVATTEGETLLPLFGSTTFTGTLDGDSKIVEGFTTTVGGFIVNGTIQGTVKNIILKGMTVNYSTDDYFVGILAKQSEGATFNGVKIDTCSLTALKGTYGAGGLVGRAHDGNDTVTNVTVDNLTISATGLKGVGGIFGLTGAFKTFSFTNCCVKNSSITGGDYVGGYVGGPYSFSRDEKYIFNGCDSLNNTVSGATGASLMVGTIARMRNLSFTDCVVSGNVTARYRQAGGFVGTYYDVLPVDQKDPHKNDGNTNGYKANITFDNVSVIGIDSNTPTVITNTSTSDTYGAAGALVGIARRSMTVTVENNSRIENVNIVGAQAATILALDIWALSGDSGVTVNASDLTVKNVSLNGEKKSTAVAGGSYTTSLTNVVFDNVSVVQNGTAAATPDALMGSVTSKTNVTIANSGLGEISDFYEQTAEGEEVRHYRLAALSTADREAYDMKVTAVYGGYNYEWVADANAALETLDAYNGMGENMGLDAATVNGSKFIAVVIQNAPKAAMDFNVSISYTDGEITWVETCTVSYDANGVCRNSVAVQ